MKKNFCIFVFLIILIVSAASQEGVYGTGDTKILLAFEPTRFKKDLMENMIRILDDGSHTVQVVNHKKAGLEGLRSEDFDAVFITNSGAMAKVRPDVTAWLDDNGGNPLNVIVHTTQRTVWTPDVDVDSVTSASLRKKDEIELMAEDLAGRILSLIP